MASSVAGGDGPPQWRLVLDSQGTELDGGWAKMQRLSPVTAKVTLGNLRWMLDSDHNKQDLGEIHSVDFSGVDKGQHPGTRRG